MEDWQFGLLLTAVTGGLAAIAGAIRWSVKRYIASTDRNTEMLLKNTESNAVLSTKIDAIARFVKRARTTPGEGMKVIDE